MRISRDKQGLFDDLKQRYQYLLDSSYPDEIVFLKRKLVYVQMTFIYFFTCCR